MTQRNILFSLLIILLSIENNVSATPMESFRNYLIILVHGVAAKDEKDGPIRQEYGIQESKLLV